MSGCKGNVEVFWRRCRSAYETENRQICRQRLENITNPERSQEKLIRMRLYYKTSGGECIYNTVVGIVVNNTKMTSCLGRCAICMLRCKERMRKKEMGRRSLQKAAH
jgi:hypothetical protein